MYTHIKYPRKQKYKIKNPDSQRDLQDLNQITVSFYTIRNRKIWVRSELKASSVQILRTAQIKLPKRILKMSH